MSNWTYRISKQTFSNGDTVFAIREFYPNSKGELTSWNQHEITPVGLTLEDLTGELVLIMQALDQGVVDIGDEKNGLGDPPEWERLINESIKTLEFIRGDLESQDLNSLAKEAIVKGFLTKLGEDANV